MGFRYYLGLVCLNQYFGDRLISFQSLRAITPGLSRLGSCLPPSSGQLRAGRWQVRDQTKDQRFGLRLVTGVNGARIFDPLAATPRRGQYSRAGDNWHYASQY